MAIITKGMDGRERIQQSYRMLKRAVWKRLRPSAIGVCLLAGAVAGVGADLTNPVSSLSTNRPAPAPRRPNIILIMADDLGYGDLGCYGQTRIKTPNIDRLAAEGLRFTSFYAGSTVCAPSRCSLMTGYHMGHAHIRGNAAVWLRDSDRTIAELLRESGYRTGLVGKWALGIEDTSGLPEKQGFDEVVAFLSNKDAHDYYSDHLWRVDPRNEFAGRMTFPENRYGKKGLYTHDLFTKAAVNFIRINKPDQFNRHRPFFLYLAYTIPHANNEEGQRTGNGMQVPTDAPYSNETWPQTEKNKAAMITRMDADIGRLLDTLKQYKIDDNTVIFFSSDNGPHREGGVDPKFFQSSGPFRGIKRDLYEGGIRVPMIVRWPKKIKPGGVSDHVGAFWDVLPTAAEIALQKPPTNTDGISFFPVLTGQAQTNQHEFLYWEFHERGSKQAVRHGDWKALLLKPGAELELYNLKPDPAETNNVAAQNAAVVQRIEAYLKTARTESENWPLKAPPDQQDPPKK